MSPPLALALDAAGLEEGEIDVSLRSACEQDAARATSRVHTGDHALHSISARFTDDGGHFLHIGARPPLRAQGSPHLAPRLHRSEPSEAIARAHRRGPRRGRAAAEGLGGPLHRSARGGRGGLAARGPGTRLRGEARWAGRADRARLPCRRRRPHGGSCRVWAEQLASGELAGGRRHLRLAGRGLAAAVGSAGRCPRRAARGAGARAERLWAPLRAARGKDWPQDAGNQGALHCNGEDWRAAAAHSARCGCRAAAVADAGRGTRAARCVRVTAHDRQAGEAPGAHVLFDSPPRAMAPPS